MAAAHSDIVGVVPAVRRISKRAVTAGIMTAMLLADLFFVLLVYANSQLLPGNWSPLLTPMMIYVGIGTIALLLIVAREKGEPSEDVRVDRFLLLLLASAAGTELLMAAAFGRIGLPSPLTGVAQLQDIVFVAFFVAPMEESLFRVALPLKWGWAVPVVLFPVMHLGAYTASGLVVSDVPLISQIIEVGAIGLGLWFINRFVGFGASIGVHMAYDLSVLGAIGGFEVAAAHLQLVWV